MKLLVLYRPNSEHTTQVESFVRDFQRQFYEAGKKVEMVSMDSREGAAYGSLYDIMEFPSILAIESDGTIINAWVGFPLPLMNDVAGYVQAGR